LGFDAGTGEGFAMQAGGLVFAELSVEPHSHQIDYGRLGLSGIVMGGVATRTFGSRPTR
jgi:hypothetical protein